MADRIATVHTLPHHAADTSDGGALPWAELHVHSNFSFLQGAADPRALTDEAARLGITTLALTDRDGLYGARRLTQAAREAGIATVFGAELTLGDPELGTPVVIARDLEGFSRLSTAISEAQLAGTKGAPRYDLGALTAAAASGHWTVLPGCLTPDEHNTIPDVTTIASRLDRLTSIFGAGTVVAELTDHHLPITSLRNDLTYVAARRTGCEIVATGAVHYAHPSQTRLAQALAALRRRQTLTAAAGHLMPAPTAHLRSGTEMARALARYPGVWEATVELGRQTAIDLGQLQPELPGFPTPDGHDEDSWLRHLAETACTTRYGPRTDSAAGAAWRQLDHELTMISALGMAGYFLIVWDIVAFAQRSGIWCQGRGSAVSSVVCYVLGVTGVDPIRHGLLFERFLHLEKSDPDIDVDFENGRREEVIQYVYDRYGRDHAAQVANIITYQPRLAIRDSARVLGYPATRIDEMTRHIHHQPPGPDSAIPDDVRTLAAQLHTLPRHLGVHSGGMVLTRRPIAEFMPVEWATAPGRSVLQGDKDDAATAGFLKIDLLGLGILAAIHTACDLITEHHGTTYDLATIPPDDPEVYAMIARADTIGVFQVESRAQISMLPRLKPKTFQDLVIAVSLIRPGPIQGGAVHPYLRRRSGREPVTYPHPLARSALEKTLGVALFQEQAMRLAIDCAGLSPGAADRLRKAMAAKHSAAKVAALRNQLIEGMRARDIDEDTAAEITHMIEAFADYGFPESHGQSLAHLVYTSAWLRCHYPAAYTAALLVNQPMGFYSPLSLIGDARRRGITVRGADIHASGIHATLEPDPTSPTGQPAIRLGLASLRHLTTEAAQQIVTTRPFTSLDDFGRRTRLSARAYEALATAGALTGFGIDRREALWSAGALTHATESQLPGAAEAHTPPHLPTMTVVEQTFADLWATGASPDTHPVQHLRDHLGRCGATTAADVRHLADHSAVLLGGLVTHRQRPPTAKGFCFLNVEDETGMANVIVPPSVWDRYHRVAVDHAGLLIHGTVQRADGAINIRAHRLEPLRLSQAS
ncbi:error-prone DNA polymerase (plasmid) [Streptomyces sp. NBC_01298]|uniref:error-prone DNA polymerase n=1 Tax=Streptomyces sp. NBC_01298 TaxID=2903817 RepID=UPI002E0FFE51|nr:error-prone DNA polymerase [Streptomyces sp. NBC_01298]